MVRAIIFDLDGVLLESTQAKSQSFRELFAEYPHHVESIVAYHAAHAGVSRFDKLRHVFACILKKPLSEKQLRSLCDQYSRLVLGRVLAAPLVPGAVEFLRDHHRDLSLFIASGTPHDELHRILEQRQLLRYFQGAFGSPSSKTQIVNRILSYWSFQPSQVAFVGDSEVDLEAATCNKVRFIARAHSGNPPTWNGRSDFMKVKDMSELWAMLTLPQD
jgi:phosphoglycolate phosphatase-like HAD superfamily hydrolase